jgi:hypothetical protein
MFNPYKVMQYSPEGGCRMRPCGDESIDPCKYVLAEDYEELLYQYEMVTRAGHPEQKLHKESPPKPLIFPHRH